MDRLDAMRLFVRVAELGSFSAVAQQLGVARSVVTRQVVFASQQRSATHTPAPSVAAQAR